ncbi:MAG TPA: plastocyanin/azurin family copper-binding protein [Solirubrobacterales bacterium]|nr:plastocyanin/azurin family copper-binding protein [Solirubrobacterales bacterium]
MALAIAGFGLALGGIWDAGADARPAPGATAQASRTATVEIADFAFKPATVRIGKGSSVRFANSSGVKHTATRAGGFDTGTIKPGKSVAIRFGQKGSFAYHCTIHPFMKGKVVVD